jgi:hypothetical protein
MAFSLNINSQTIPPSIQWQKSIGGSTDDYPNSIIQTSDGGYIVAGCSNSNNGDVTGNNVNYNYWVVKLDTSGNIQWQKSFSGSNDDEAYSIQETSNGGFIIAGGSSSINGDVLGNHVGWDYWIVKLNSTPLKIIELNRTSAVSIFPNPSKADVTVNFPNTTKYTEIFDILGHEIEKKPIFQQIEMKFEMRYEGIYLIRIITDKETITKKIVISNE